MSEITPCSACEAQQKMGRLARPHPNLSVLASKAFLGCSYEGHAEYVFKCRTCGTLTYYTNDKNCASFWSIIEKAPEYCTMRDFLVQARRAVNKEVERLLAELEARDALPDVLEFKIKI
jgi:hypothetical protein